MRPEDIPPELMRITAFLERLPDQHMRFGVVRPDGTTQMMPCADWCMPCRVGRAVRRAEKAEAVIAAVRAVWEDHRARHPLTGPCECLACRMWAALGEMASVKKTSDVE